MESLTKENFKMIKDMDRVLSNGLMGGNMKEVGLEVNNMELEFILIKQEKVGKENGTKERGCVGWIEVIFSMI